VIHETGHHYRKEAFDILASAVDSRHKEGKQFPSALQGVFNMAEDFGMERAIAQRYRGDAKALGIYNRDNLLEFIENDQVSDPKWQEMVDSNPEHTKALAMLAIQEQATSSWSYYTAEAFPKLVESLPPASRKLYDTLVDEGWADKLIDSHTVNDTWDYACDLYKRLMEDDDEPESTEEEVEQMRQAGHEQKVEQGDQQPAPGEGEDGGEGSEGDGEGEGDDPWQTMQLTGHGPGGEPCTEHAKFNENASAYSSTYDTVAIAPDDLIRVHNSWNPLDRLPLQHDADKYMSDNSQARTFGNRVRRYLQSTQRTHIEREKLTGSLDKRAIVRLALPPIDGGEYNKKIFYGYSDKTEFNTAIFVLTDWSGSMSGEKEEHAADATGRLVHTFDRVLRMPVMSAAFTTSYTECVADVGIIKPWHKRMNQQEIAEAFASFRRYMSGNADADALSWAYNQLLQRPEKRRILIVLSDGQPTDGYEYSNPQLNLKHMTQAIESRGLVELWGIGIKSQAVEDYYTHHKVLRNSEDINTTLFEVIRDGHKQQTRR
jgi:cobaltochelatase CobT